MKKVIAICLLASMAAAMLACGDTDKPTDVTTESTDSESSDAAEREYQFPRYDGYEFTVLNAGDVYSMHGNIDTEATGELLSDTMYNRCRTLEDKTGIKFIETTKHVDSELADHAMQVIMANEDLYDLFFVPARSVYRFASEGCLHNLLDYDEFNFDKSWWLSNYNSKSTINGSLYAAASYTQLMIVDSVWAVYYNETMGENLKLDTPYQTVLDGKWTLDVMNTYMAAAANLNGDNDFKFRADGNATYGIAHENPQTFLSGADETFLDNDNGKLVFTGGSERFYDVLSKLVSIFDESDGRWQWNRVKGSDDEPGHAVYAFEHERALMSMIEIAKTNRMRDKSYSFGILPLPKYDELQENYVSTPFYGFPAMSIPVTVSDPERSAAIGDALAYLSYDMVWPVFRHTTLEQKNLRNEESIEMMDVIINSVVPDLVYIYSEGCISMRDNIQAYIKDGKSEFASLVAQYEEQIKTELAKINGD
ncbi:MAG: hypothetical protein HFE63_02595 [Clostridiales bacterium]|nr:hypothetical protein [Clostridiales bacterium]